jgi:phosphate transport system substrate-binding protein
MRGFRAAAVALLSIIASPALAGELPVVGTGDGIDVLTAVGAAFSADHPEITVRVPPSIHSSGGVRAVHYGTHVLGRIARLLSDNEKALGIVETPVFSLPAAFFVHHTAGTADLTVDQVTRIYAGEITNWKDVGGADLRIKVVRRENVDSTLNVFRNTLPGWKDLVILERSKTATTTQDAIDTVAEVEGTIGFGPFSRDLEKKVVVLRLSGIYPADPKYPSGITLSLIHREATITEEARHFLDFMGSAKAHAVIEQLGAVPLKRPAPTNLARGG